MDGWTSQRVLALAPDAASAKAGEGLAAARKWVSLGFDERAAWGECQGAVLPDATETTSMCQGTWPGMISRHTSGDCQATGASAFCRRSLEVEPSHQMCHMDQPPGSCTTAGDSAHWPV